MSGPSGGDQPNGRGVWLGVDVGTVRIGIARSDPRAVLAVPVETVPRDARRGRDLTRLAELVEEFDVVGVVVGLPVTLSGRHGPSATMATEFGAALAARIDPVPVTFADERLSTVVAARTLSERGVRGAAGRAVIDQVAAVAILQTWLDHQSRSVRGTEDS